MLQIRRDRVHYYNYVTLIVFQLLYDWTFFSCIDLSLNGHCALLVIYDKSLWIVICFLVLVIWVYQRSVCWVFCCWNDDNGLFTAFSDAGELCALEPRWGCGSQAHQEKKGGFWWGWYLMGLWWASYVRTNVAPLTKPTGSRQGASTCGLHFKPKQCLNGAYDLSLGLYYL